MNKLRANKKSNSHILRPAAFILLAATLVTGGIGVATVNVSANHPVLVEGNCNGAGAAARTLVPLGTCGDYDGDGRIGTAEDTDGTDRVFGTINAALGAANGGVNQNGSVTIVASGVFPEVVIIGSTTTFTTPGGVNFTGGSATPGNVTLQAAPGVEAEIDAVLAGEPGSTARQAAPGIIVNSPANRYVVIRNITSRNWTSGIQVRGDSRVAIENSRLENNVNYGVEITDNSRVTIAKSEVHGTGFRLNPATGNFPTANTPNPGKGIEFDDNSSGSVFLTTVSGSFGAGISNVTDKRSGVCAYLVNVFDNNPDFENVRPSEHACGSDSRSKVDK